VLRYAWGALMKNQFNGDRNVEASGSIVVNGRNAFA